MKRVLMLGNTLYGMVYAHETSLKCYEYAQYAQYP